MNKFTRIQSGDLYIMGAGVLWSFFPFLASAVMVDFPALLVTGLSNLVAGVFLSLLITKDKAWKTLYHKKAFKDVVLTVFFIAILAYFLLFTATGLTSSNNVAILGLSQILWGFVILGCLKMERFTYEAFIGSFIIIAGAALVLYSGNMQFNRGDLLVIAANACFVVGNIFQRRARQNISSIQLLFIRSLLAGLVCTIVSLVQDPFIITTLPLKACTIIIALGVFIFSIEKIFWVEGMHRIAITRANTIASIHPGLTMLWGVILFNSTPTHYQWGGFILMIIGAWFIILKKDIFKILKT